MMWRYRLHVHNHDRRAAQYVAYAYVAVVATVRFKHTDDSM